MADNSTEKEYMVYCHESPHGKRYVGITCVGEKKRWGINEYGYRNNKHFWAAIQKIRVVKKNGKKFERTNIQTCCHSN